MSLQAYYKLNNNGEDATFYSRDCSSVGTPIYNSSIKVEGSHSFELNGSRQTNYNLIPNTVVGGVMTGKTVALMAWSTKQSIHAWDGITDSVENTASSGIIYDTVDVYVGTYGEIAIKGHNLYPTTSITVYDPAKFKMAWLTKTSTRNLGIDGLTDKYSVYNEVTARYDTPTTLGRLNLTS